MSTPRILITGGGAICGAGQTPESILAALGKRRSAIGPIAQWDTEGWPVRIAAEVKGLSPQALVEALGQRRLLKFAGRPQQFAVVAAAATGDRDLLAMGV